MNSGCLLKYTLCCAPYTQGEWCLVNTTQLGAELFPLVQAAIAFKLHNHLLQVQAIVEWPCCASAQLSNRLELICVNLLVSQLTRDVHLSCLL